MTEVKYDIGNGHEISVEYDEHNITKITRECFEALIEKQISKEHDAEIKGQVRSEVIEEVFGKIEERLNDSTTVTFDLPVEDVLGDDVDMDDFLMLAEEIVQEYKNLIFSKLKQAKKQLKEQK